MTNLAALSVGGNALTGALPDTWRNLTRLEYLSLWGNRLTGTLPAWFGTLANLRNLYLNSNALTGSIPSVFGNLANLEELHLERNALTGSIPSALGNLTSLTELNLRQTVLAGTLPTSLTSLSGLKRLDIEGTGVCVPTAATFQAWLAMLDHFGSSGLTCGESPSRLTGSFDRMQYTALEGGNAPVRVRLSEVPSPSRAVTIGVTATPGNGATAADYRASATVTVWPDDDMGYFDFTALRDGVADDGETVVLRLGVLPTGVTASTPASATVTLRDDDTTTETDRAALVALYNATGGPSWTDNTNWLSTEPLSEWFGVETNDDGRVTGLDLGGWRREEQRVVGNGLSGPIPADVGNLAQRCVLGAVSCVGLLPDHMFTRMLRHARPAPKRFTELAGDLFEVMATGGRVGETVAWFNGGLFDDSTTLPLEKSDIETVLAASDLDWSEIDPSIAVRQRYSLTIDQREADALDQVLAGCASTELITFARGEVPAAATSSVRVPGTTTGTAVSAVWRLARTGSHP